MKALCVGTMRTEPANLMMKTMKMRLHTTRLKVATFDTTATVPDTLYRAVMFEGAGSF